MARKSLSNVCRLLEEATETVPVEQSFVADLKRSIELTDDKNRRQPSQSYKPSSMNCIRNMYYQMMGKEVELSHTSAPLVGICESGSDRHERVQSAVESMKENGIDCEYIDVADFVNSRGLNDIEIVGKSGMETKLFHTKYHMSFLCDGIIRYKGKYYILEIKTESIYKWQSRSAVDPYHYAQGTAYSLAFGLNEVLFLYINRDNCDMKGFMLNVTDDMRQDLVGKVLECDTYVEQKMLPPKPENVPKKSCTYCNYAKYCSREES